MNVNQKTGGKKSMARIFFDKFDEDGSGSIDKEEFHNLCYDRGHYLSDDEMTLAMKIVDPDGSGTVSFEEFDKWWSQSDRFEHLRMSDENQVKLKQTSEFFQFFDKDRSGALDKKEFNALYEQLKTQGYALKEYAHCIEEIDKDHDGTINFNEFLAWMIQMGVFK